MFNLVLQEFRKVFEANVIRLRPCIVKRGRKESLNISLSPCFSHLLHFHYQLFHQDLKAQVTLFQAIPPVVFGFLSFIVIFFCLQSVIFSKYFLKNNF